MTYAEQRADLMKLADELTRQRNEAMATINKMNEGITALVIAADKLLPLEMEETPQGTKKREYSYTTTKPSPEQVAEYTKPGRKCGICHEPGHRRETCPNAHKIKGKFKEEEE